MIVAAFDFDGTLTRRDTLIPFLVFVRGPWVVSAALLVCLPRLAGMALGGGSRQKAKEQLLRICLRGKSKQELAQAGEAFARQRLPRLMRPEALQRLQWHVSRGDTCVIVSASLDLYLSPWGDENGFQAVICSRLDFDQRDMATGNLDGANCRGVEKPA